MIPNSAVYGLENTWLHVFPYSNYNTNNKNKKPTWQTITGGITANKIIYPEPLDNSICYAAIADNSPIANIRIVKGDNSETVDTLPLVSPIFPAFMDVSSYGKTSTTQYNVNDLSDYIYSFVNMQNLPSNNMNSDIQPLCSLSPKDAVLKIVIRAYSENWDDWQTFKYSEYITNQSYLTYPHIFHIYCLPYARNENSESRSRVYINETGSFFIARDVEYDIINDITNIRDYNLTNLKGGSFNGLHVWGLTAVNGQESFYNSSALFYQCIGNGTIKIINNSVICMYHDYDASDDFVHKCVASLGLFFCDDDNTAENGAYNSNTMYLGTIDENGLCHGDYTKGTDNEDQPQYAWNSTNDSAYDPQIPIDPNHYTDSTPFSTGTVGNAFVKYYIMSLSDLQQLNGKLFDYLDLHDPAVMDINTYLYKEFLSTNPLDCVIGLKKFTLNFSNIIDLNELTGTTLKLGRYDTNISCRAFSTVTTKTYNFGSALIWRYYGDFRDFEPYTTIDLVVPFCGVKRLDLGLYMGHTLNLKMCVDVFTGYVTCYIFVDNICVDSLNGNCSIDLPVSGIQTASLTQSLADQLQNQYISQTKYDYGIKNLGINLMTGASNTLFSFKGGGASLAGPIGLIAMGGLGASAKMNELNMQGDIDRASLAKQEFDLRHTIAPIATVGSISPTNALCQPMKAYLIIHRCKMMNYDPEIYSKTIGYACLKNGLVKHFSGYTQASDICLDSVNCTAAEKAMIKRAFTTGVYL